MGFSNLQVYGANGGLLVDIYNRIFTGGFRREIVDYTAAGALQAGKGIILTMANASGMAMTLAAPTAGDDLIIYNRGAAGDITVTLPSGVTWDGTNRVATFGPGDSLHVAAVSTTRYLILANNGSVAFS